MFFGGASSSFTKVVSHAATSSAKAEGGRVAHRRAELRKRVLRASLELFGQQGIASTSMSELIAAADTSAGAFYGLFVGKDALVQALIEEAIDPVADAIDDLAKTAANPAATLGLGLRTALAVAIRNPHWGHFVSQSTMLNHALESGFRPRVTRDIRQAQQDGVLPELDEIVAVALMLGAFQAGVTLANQDLLTDRIACDLTERTLVAIGMEPDLANEIATRPLPAIRVNSDIDLGWT